MQPNFRFGGGATETILHPVSALVLLVAAALILVLPRHKAIAPFLLAFFDIPLAQVIVVGGLHFPVLRILILTVVARMVLLPVRRSEKRLPGGFNALDKVVVLWTLSTLIMFCIQWMETQAIIKGMGDLIDSLGGYMAMRFLIPDRATVRRALRVLAAVCVIQGALMFTEKFTQQNVLAFAGGTTPQIRSGHLRSEGSIGTLYAGALAGALIPMFFWMWKERSRFAALAGLVGATAMVVASHASTSAMTYAAALLAVAFWPVRKFMRLVRWGIVVLLVGLHLVMHGPVWSLISWIDVGGGSTSWQRYVLIDMTIRHFGGWWLVGAKDYGNWGWGAWDLCNQFVVTALTGGLLTFVLFVMIFTRSLGALGRARKSVEGARPQAWFFWCIGSSLVAVIFSCFGINYMVQLQVFLFMLLAFVSVACFQDRQQVLPTVLTAEERFASDYRTAEPLSGLDCEVQGLPGRAPR